MSAQELMTRDAAPQLSSPFGFAPYPSSNGFDFGLSRPKTGLGYGLLGDTRSLASSQTCADCPSSDPCPNCSGDSAESNADPNGRIIKTQVPIPMPGLFPPPPIITTPTHPSQPPIIGNPNAPWNWTPDKWADWAHGIFESRRPTNAVARKCDEQLDAEYRRCEAIARKATAEAGPKRGSRELISCKDNAGMRHAECRANNGTSKSPIYPDWYADPPYPDDFENPYPG